MLLAPSFSPKVQTVLDCLFNAVGALAGRTCPSTSRSFASSVVLAMPGKARVATLAPKLLVHPRAQTLPAQKRGTAHSTPMDLSPRLCWTWAGMRTCRSPCPSLFQLPLAAFWAAVGCCARPSWAWWGAGGAALLGPGSVGAQTLTALHWPLSQWINHHRHIRETHGTGGSWAFWSRTCFLYFQYCSFSCEQTPSSKYIPPYRAENLYKNWPPE